MAAPSDIINWQEAMQQVGDDEEFLKELLADLRSELQTQLTTIQGIIQVGSLASATNVVSIYLRRRRRLVTDRWIIIFVQVQQMRGLLYCILLQRKLLMVMALRSKTEFFARDVLRF